MQTLLHITLVVRDYDEALAFFVAKVGFTLIEDTFLPEQNKRWVLVAPRGSSGTRVLLAKATNDEQRASVGNQTGGRVAFFLGTDDIRRDHAAMRAAGVEFVREPKTEPHGTVAVFADLYGNRWDLIERSEPPRLAARALPALLALYCAASFVHFWHNAEFLMDYPNLPAWLTRVQVYAVWLGITAIGAVGYLLLRARWRRLGLAVLAVYAAIGFDGLLHYTRAPFMAHSGTMNVTIWSEVVAAALVLVAVVGLLVERSRPS